ncbi:hypothetical protein CPB84DRAFT_1771448, partial [Gymnopilus junonius]
MLSQTQNPYPSMNPSPGFYGNFLHHNPMPPQTQLPPLSSLDFPWHALPPQHVQAGPVSGPQHYGSHQVAPSTGHQSLPYIDTNIAPGPSSEATRGRSRVQRSPSVPRTAQGHSTSSPEVELSEAERFAIAEEKRRRNTAASGKKQNLSRVTNVLSKGTFESAFSN